MTTEEMKAWTPTDPANGRPLCTPEKPMPKGAPGQWAHEDVECVGSCRDGCCDDYRCKSCGTTWRVELPD
jgi:hypothetical protein